MAFASYYSDQTATSISMETQFRRRVAEIEEHYRRKERDIERHHLQRSMANPFLSVQVEKEKCKSCNGVEHGGKVDMIGYCEKRLEKYYKNLSKLVSSKKNI